MRCRKLLLASFLLGTLSLMVSSGPTVSHAALDRPSDPAVNLRLSGQFGDEVRISTTVGAFGPAVAYNSNRDEYLVVWEAGDTVHAQRLPRKGTLVGSAFIGSYGIEPAVAYNAQDDQYLIVWSSPVPGSGLAEIWGSVYSWDGSPIGNPQGPHIIWAWSNRAFRKPKVAWNSVRNEYFVIWNAADSNSGIAMDISGVHVSAAGAPDVWAHNLSVWDKPHQGDIVCNPTTDQYYFVWRSLPLAATQGSLTGGRVDGDGKLIPPVNGLSSGSGDDRDPFVTTNGSDRYFVTWVNIDWVGLKSQIVGRQISADGYWMGIPVVITPMIAVSSLGPPAVVAMRGVPDTYLVLWQESGSGWTYIRASVCSLHDAYAPVCSPFYVRSASTWNTGYVGKPSGAAGARGYFIAYGAEDQGHQMIYGRVWWPGLFLPLVKK